VSSGDKTGGPSLQRKIEILNQYGIHARPAAMIVKIANRFRADLFFEKDGTRVSGKSIMGLMTLEASYGSRVLIVAEGPDAEQVLDEIEGLAGRKFDED
jgi:phosphocarrier protein